MKCIFCKGTGRDYSPHLYYGVAECGVCQGVGLLSESGDRLTEEELEALINDPVDARDVKGGRGE